MVLPQSNLPGDAVPWGRAVEDRLGNLTSASGTLNETANNSSRFTGGQLSVFGVQSQEQLDRTTVLVSGGSISVTGSGTAEPFPRNTKTIPFSVPAGSRNAQVEFYADASLADPGNATSFAYLSYNGEIIIRALREQITDLVIPFTSPDPWLYYGLANVTLPESGVGNFTLTIVRVGFTGIVTTESLTNVRIYITPFQKAV